MLDQIINSTYQKTIESKESKYKIFYDENENENENEEVNEYGYLLEPEVPDKDTLITKQPITSEVPLAPAGEKGVADPLGPKDTVDTGTPAAPTAAAGGKGEAEVVGAMVGIMSEMGVGNVGLQRMVDELKEKGLQARVVDAGAKGTIEVIASDGTAVQFKDQDGDGAIGALDGDFRKAVQKHVPDQYDQLMANKSKKKKK
jgi:hypothetical protein